MLKILLAIDDSKFSEAAARMLISQNQPSRTTVRVLHVVEPIEASHYPEEVTPPYPIDFNDIRKKRRDAGRKLAERVMKKLGAAGFKVDSSVPVAHARTSIIDIAGKWGADLIVMGSHGRKGIERLLLGSVSEYVVRHAPCSVQVVRIPSTRR
jgi:nucleotide-binding universal stress UspA family protein